MNANIYQPISTMTCETREKRFSDHRYSKHFDDCTAGVGKATSLEVTFLGS